MSLVNNASHVKFSLRVSERSLVLSYLFLVLPIFDMINGTLVVRGILPEGGLASPAQIGRLIATGLLAWAMVRQRLNISPLLVLLYPLSVELLAGFLYQQEFGLAYGIMSVYRFLFLFAAFVVMDSYLDDRSGLEKVARFLKWNLLLISLTLSFSIMSGLGNSTYGYGFGTKGFFSSGNGLGAYLGSGTLLLVGLRKYGLYSDISRLEIIFIAVSTAMIGTKASMVFCGINLLVLLLDSRFRYFWVSLFGLAIAESLPKLSEALRTVFDVVLRRYERADSLIEFIGSGRMNYVDDAVSTLSQQGHSTVRYILGSGSFLSFQDPYSVVRYDTLETDLFDLLFMYGIPGVLFYLAVFSIASIRLQRYPILLLALILMFLHSFVAGHVVFNGMGAMMMAVLFATSSFLTRSRPRAPHD
jgi:hypothetical protein